MVPYKEVFKELESRGIKYLIAGGFAVNFHRVQRSTVDLDLIVRLEPNNWASFVGLMKDLGFQPRLPVDPQQLADETVRNDWIENKNMTVFSFLHSSNPLEIIDVLVKDLRPFDELWERRLEVEAFGDKLKVVGRDHLIEMKEQANRPQDIQDVERLKNENEESE